MLVIGSITISGKITQPCISSVLAMCSWYAGDLVYKTYPAELSQRYLLLGICQLQKHLLDIASK